MKHYSGAIAKVAPTFDFNCFEKSNVGVPTEAMADGRDKARSLCLAFFCLLIRWARHPEREYRRHSQVVRQRSAKPLFIGSIPIAALIEILKARDKTPIRRLPIGRILTRALKFYNENEEWRTNEKFLIFRTQPCGIW